MEDKKSVILWLAERVSERAESATAPWIFKVSDGIACLDAKQKTASAHGIDFCKFCCVKWGTPSGSCADYVPLGRSETKYQIEAANGGVPTLPWLRAFEIELRKWAQCYETSSLSGLRDPKAVTAIGESSTILEGHELIFRSLREDKKIVCPCCERVARVDRRSISAPFAAALILLLRYTEFFNPEGGWVHIRREIASKDERLKKLNLSSNWGYHLRSWGLIERHPKDHANYRITDKGVSFVKGQISVPRTAFVYNNKVLFWSEEDVVNVFAALEGKVEYHLLMNTYRGLKQ